MEIFFSYIVNWYSFLFLVASVCVVLWRRTLYKLKNQGVQSNALQTSGYIAVEKEVCNYTIQVSLPGL